MESEMESSLPSILFNNQTMDKRKENLSKILKDINIDLPDYLFKLLAINGYDNIFSLVQIDQTKISILENFAQTKLSRILTGREKTDFFGIFAGNEDIFEIVQGDKDLLIAMKAKLEKTTIKQNSEEENKTTGIKRQKESASESANSKRKVLNKQQSNGSSTSRSSSIIIEDSNSGKSSGDESEQGVSVVVSVHNNKEKAERYIKQRLKKYIENYSNEIVNDEVRQECLKLSDELHVDADLTNHVAKIRCSKCQFISTAYHSLKTNGSRKWSPANVLRHYKTHFKNPTTKQTVGKQKKIVQLDVTAYLKKKNKDEDKDKENHQKSIETEMQFVDPNQAILNNITTEVLTADVSSLNTSSNVPNQIYIDECTDLGTDLLTTTLTTHLTSSPQFFSQGRTADGSSGSAVEKNISHENPSEKALPDKAAQVNQIISSSELSEFSKKRKCNQKYSRSFRNISKLNSFSESQTLLTDYFDKVLDTVRKDRQIQEVLQTSLETNITTIHGPVEVTSFLKELNETAEKNCLMSKNKRTFTKSLKQFSLYLFITGGRLSYELLYKNLDKALPSPSTLSRLLAENSDLYEGTVRVVQLKNYLSERNYKPKVWISEDQTALINKVEYDSKTNNLVGFVPEIDTKTGFPLSDTFQVNSARDVQIAFENNSISCNAYIYVAQPLEENSPPFILSIFGSNNVFEHCDVKKRWRYIRETCAENEVSVLGYSSDGDTRCLKAMKQIIDLPSESNNPFGTFFKVSYSTERPNCIQDTVHIATKLRTKLLKTGRTELESKDLGLNMGNKTVTAFHIEEMMSLYGKDQHLLTRKHLEVKDKMNFEAAEKICDQRVINLLKNISHSEGTIQYLNIMRDTLDGFLEKKLTVLERVYNIWKSVFFLRAWRNWTSERKSMQKNFITLNAYTCIEINAHELLLLVEKCRDDPSSFLPWLFSSQQCEKVFRQTRSQTSTYSTKVNFTLLDLLHRLNRIEALTKITHDLGNQYRFPREENKRLGTGAYTLEEMPQLSDIKNTLRKAMEDASDLARQFGIENPDCETVLLKTNSTEDISEEISEESDYEQELSQQEDCNEVFQEGENVHSLIDMDGNDMCEDLTVLKNIDILELRDYSTVSSEKNSNFVTLKLKNKVKKVRKSALCWYFNENKGRLSSDRIYRVRGMTEKGAKKKKKIAKPPLKKSKKGYSSSESDEESDNFYIESSTETEDENKNDGTDLSTEEIKLEKECYYAVYYDEDWYIGRILDIRENSVVMKFLKKNLENLEWPAKPDIQDVDKQFIFYGPLKLEGTNPFRLTRYHLNTVKMKYKEERHKMRM